MIVRTGAILIYGQERANVSSAIARRASLLPYCPEFPALMTATPLSATRLDAQASRKTSASRESRRGTEESVRYKGAV